MQLNQLYMYLFIGIGIVLTLITVSIPLYFRFKSKRANTYQRYGTPNIAFATLNQVTNRQAYANAVEYKAPVRSATQEIPVSNTPVRHTGTREYTVTGVKVIPSKPRFQVIQTKEG